jgi:hypothetical protein
MVAESSQMKANAHLANIRDLPVFICGHPKSGTSLLRSILDSHPQLIVYPEETVFFRRFLPIAQGQTLERQLALAEEYLIHIFTWNFATPPASQKGFPDRDYSSIPFEAIKQEMRDLVAATYRDERDILSSVILAYGKVTGQLRDTSRHWVEKSPYNEFFGEQIFHWWPESRCIHVVRDPRDNYLSYHSKHATWSPEFFSLNWRRSIQAGEDNFVKYGKNRYRIIRYEDLVQSPEELIPQIMEFLQIEWDSSLFTPTRGGTSWQGNSMFSNKFTEISAAPVGRWREKLSEIDTLVIQKICREDINRFNYPAATTNPSLPKFATHLQKLIASTRVSTWPIRQKFSIRKGKR